MTKPKPSESEKLLQNETEAGTIPLTYVTSILTIRISSSGRSFHTLTPSIFFTTSNPPTARPKTVCFPSNHGHRSVVMKN